MFVAEGLRAQTVHDRVHRSLASRVRRSRCAAWISRVSPAPGRWLLRGDREQRKRRDSSAGACFSPRFLCEFAHFLQFTGVCGRNAVRLAAGACAMAAQSTACPSSLEGLLAPCQLIVDRQFRLHFQIWFRVSWTFGLLSVFALGVVEVVYFSLFAAANGSDASAVVVTM